MTRSARLALGAGAVAILTLVEPRLAGAAPWALFACLLLLANPGAGRTRMEPAALWRSGENSFCLRPLKKRLGDEGDDLSYAAAVSLIQLP